MYIIIPHIEMIKKQVYTITGHQTTNNFSHATHNR